MQIFFPAAVSIPVIIINGTDAYFRIHETELILFIGAENILKRFEINPKNLDLEQLQTDYNALLAKKAELRKTYKSAEKKSQI